MQTNSHYSEIARVASDVNKRMQRSHYGKRSVLDNSTASSFAGSIPWGHISPTFVVWNANLSSN
jgi:hypothetical protein